MIFNLMFCRADIYKLMGDMIIIIEQQSVCSSLERFALLVTCCPPSKLFSLRVFIYFPSSLAACLAFWPFIYAAAAAAAATALIDH